VTKATLSRNRVVGSNLDARRVTNIHFAKSLAAPGSLLKRGWPFSGRIGRSTQAHETTRTKSFFRAVRVISWIVLCFFFSCLVSILFKL